MRRLVLLLALLGVGREATAQACYSTQGSQEYCNALTPAVRFGFPRYATAALPTCASNNTGAIAYNTTDSEVQVCNGSAWVAVGGSGSGDVTAVGDCASGACFNGTQGTTLTFNNAGGDATIDYDGTDFSISKPISVTGTIALTSTITFPDNVRQTFNPGADAAGLNVGSVASDPGTPSNGDIWYDSGNNTMDARINGATVSLGAGGGAPTDATYITQTANGSLSAEQALGALATGCLGSTTTTGVVAARTITGTSNEVSVANGDCSGAPTISLPATIDLGGKTSLEIPNGASPTTDAFGEIAGDNDAQAASRGSVQFYDGTANTYLVGVLASDTCTNGQVPTWNTGGTWTCETPSSSSGITLLCKGAPATTTTGTTEEVVATCTVAANTLSAAGHALRVTWQAITAANANNKQIRIRVGGVGGTLVMDSGAVASNAQQWTSTAPLVVTRTSASTASAAGAMGRVTSVGGTNLSLTTNFGATADDSVSVDWTASQDLVITMTTPTASGDMTLVAYQMELLK